MYKTCTWKDCNLEGKHEILDRNGIPWANLCDDHFKQHDDALNMSIKKTDKESIKMMLGAWVNAQGGAKKAAKRVIGGNNV